MDPSLLQKLQQLQELLQAGVISAAVRDQQQAQLLAADAGLQQFAPPALVAPNCVAMSVQPVQVASARHVQPQLQQRQQPPRLQLAPAPPPTGPTAQQLAAQQQLDALQQAQAAQLVQMQQQMQQQMAAAQAAVSAAAPAPAATPQVQFREQAKARSSSSGEKPAAPATAAAAAAPRKVSEKQSTDLDSKAKGSSGGTEKRAIVVMFCNICDSTAMSEEMLSIFAAPGRPRATTASASGPARRRGAAGEVSPGVDSSRGRADVVDFRGSWAAWAAWATTESRRPAKLLRRRLGCKSAEV